jgi:CheY-like chemotaxis protein
MDCQMPILDGCGATKAIRQFESATQMHTPIIAMTASNLESDLKLCLAAGMDDIIEKPFTPAQLNQKITSWLCS